MKEISYQADVVVIGAGLAGLVAGATLAKLGHRVVLVEQHYVPGGCATTFKRRDFVMEVGLHAMDGFDCNDPKMPALDFLEVQDNIDIVPLPDFYRLSTANTDCTVPANTEEMFEQLSAQFPDDRKALRKFLDLMINLRREIKRFPQERWKFLVRLPVFPLLFPKIVFFGERTVGKYLDANLKSDELKVILMANLAYYHDDPYSMSMLYFSLAQASYLEGGTYYIRGGSQKLSDYLASVIGKHGGVVLLGKEATRIQLENGAVSGVEYKDALNNAAPLETIYAKDVVVNAALPLVPDLLPPEEGTKLRKSIANKTPACSLFAVFIGFNTELHKLGNRSHSTLFTEIKINTLQELGDLLHIDIQQRGIAFVDYSQIDSGLAPKGKGYASLTTVMRPEEFEGLSAEEYEVKKEAYAQTLIDRLDQHVPGARNAIEHYEVSTPETVKKYTRNPFGTAYGYAQMPGQAGLRRPSRTSKIPGLRFASAWVLPGGGQSATIFGGYQAAQELHQHRRNRSPSKPLNIEDTRQVRFVERREVAEGTFEISFEKPANFNPTPGQYAILALEDTEHFQLDMPVRSLSIASHKNDPLVRFTMRESSSPFKQHCLSMKAGDHAKLYGPTGDFVLPEKATPVVFIAGGVGITPILSMVESLRLRGFPAPVTLLYSDKSLDSMAYHEQFEAISNSNFRFLPVFTSTQKRINQNMLGELFDQATATATEYYLVGTRGFLRDVYNALKNIGVSTACIHKDDFG